MPRRLPSSALDTQSQITAVSGSLASPQGTLSGYWKLDQKLTGNLQGNADTATKWSANVAINGTNVDGGTTPVTIGVNTTSVTTSGTYYPTFVPSNTGSNQQASTHASLNYDPNTGFLSATRFVGSGAGLTGVVKSISFNGAAAVDGAVSIAQVQSDWTQATTNAVDYIKNKPALFDGAYSSLSGKPTLFSGAYSSLSGKPTLFDGAYSSLSGIPAAPVTSVNGATGAVTLANLGFSNNVAANGYQKIPGGLIIQWGSFVGGVGFTYQAYPIAFPTTVLALTNCYVDRGAAGDYRGINGYDTSGANFGTDNCTTMWIALGY